MAVSKSDPIAIIGGGAFGLSTALELSSKGYTNVTVFEKDDEIPSRWSAANDLNKIMRAEYEDEFYKNLAIVSCARYSKHYDGGMIVGSTTNEPKGSHSRLANSPIRTLLPPRRLPKLRFWCRIPKSGRHDAQVSSRS
jgi:succinate dehydrogenase/fumarate reductase flavoprotein subunit